MPSVRGRLLTALALLATIFAGLASRRYGPLLPQLVSDYAGDTLWALAVFLMIRLGWPGLNVRYVACGAFTLAFIVELSQLYHAPWIDAVRSHTLARLILGWGFLWSDLVCYGVGVLLGVAFDRARSVTAR